jgi:hypothetical protein
MQCSNWDRYSITSSASAKKSATNFRMEKPDPAKTWNQVANMCPAKPEWCCIFSSDCPEMKGSQATGAQSTMAPHGGQ